MVVSRKITRDIAVSVAGGLLVAGLLTILGTMSALAWPDVVLLIIIAIAVMAAALVAIAFGGQWFYAKIALHLNPSSEFDIERANKGKDLRDAFEFGVMGGGESRTGNKRWGHFFLNMKSKGSDKIYRVSARVLSVSFAKKQVVDVDWNLPKYWIFNYPKLRSGTESKTAIDVEGGGNFGTFNLGWYDLNGIPSRFHLGKSSYEFSLPLCSLDWHPDISELLIETEVSAPFAHSARLRIGAKFDWESTSWSFRFNGVIKQ